MDFSMIKTWHRPKRRVGTRVICVLMSLTFIFPYLTWAFEPGNLQSGWNPFFLHDQPIEIPEKLGAITRSFQGDNRLVIHIQDLHCNYEVQMNIARVIHQLARQYGLRLVTVEGASLPINTTQLRTFPNKRIREEVSDYFVRRGKITGPEHYAATGEYPILLEGIETPKLYAANKKSIEFLLNDEALGYACDLRDALNKLKPAIYNPVLLKFDRKRMAYQAGKLSLLKYSAYLRTTAGHLHIDLAPYPNIAAYVRKQQNLFPREVNPDRLFPELDTLDQVIRQRLYTNKVQLKSDQLVHRVDIIEKLINISVTPKELAEFRQAPEAFAIQQFVDFIRQYDSKGELEPDPEIYILNQYLDAVADFYQMADQRSIHFVANLMAKIKKYEENIAILVTGGFHTDQVLSELKKKGISYLSLKPRITHRDLINPYFTLLRNKRTPLEKLLAQNQNIFTIESYFPKIQEAPATPNAANLNERERLFSRLLKLFLDAKKVAGQFFKNKLEDKLKVTVHANRILSFPCRQGVLAVVWRRTHKAPLPATDAMRIAKFKDVCLAFISPDKVQAVLTRLDAKPGGKIASQSLLRLAALYAGVRLVVRITGYLISRSDWLKQLPHFKFRDPLVYIQSASMDIKIPVGIQPPIILTSEIQMDQAGVSKKPAADKTREDLSQMREWLKQAAISDTRFKIQEKLFETYNIQNPETKLRIKYYLSRIGRTDANLENLWLILICEPVTAFNLVNVLQKLSLITQTTPSDQMDLTLDVLDKLIDEIIRRRNINVVHMLDKLTQITRLAYPDNTPADNTSVFPTIYEFLKSIKKSDPLYVVDRLVRLAQVSNPDHLNQVFQAGRKILKRNPYVDLSDAEDVARTLDKQVMIARAMGPDQVEAAFDTLYPIRDVFCAWSEDTVLKMSNQLEQIVKTAGPDAGISALKAVVQFFSNKSEDKWDENKDTAVNILSQLARVVQTVYPPAGEPALKTLHEINTFYLEWGWFDEWMKAMEKICEFYPQIVLATNSSLVSAVSFAVIRTRCIKGNNYETLEDPEKIVGDVLAVCQKHKTMAHIELLKQESVLERVSLKDRGTAPNNAGRVIACLLESVPAIQFKKPADFPDMPDVLPLSALTSENLNTLKQKARMSGKLEFHKVLGRSVIFKDEKGDKLIIKLLKKKEPNSILASECRRFKYGEPAPIEIKKGEYRFIFDLEKCSKADQAGISQGLEKASKLSKNKVGQPLEINPNYVSIAYKIKSTSKYDRYAYAGTWKDVNQAIIKAASRLGLWARKGLVHTTLADIFHNLSEDVRPYIVTVGLIAELEYFISSHTIGRIIAWPEAVWTANLSLDGEIRDFKYLKHFLEILADPDFRKGDWEFIQKEFKDKAGNVYLLEFFSRYALFFTLLLGFWQDKNNWKGINWQKPESLKDLAGCMRESYLTFLTSFRESESRSVFENLVDQLVDWERYARQMAVFMSPEHAQLVLRAESGDEKAREILAGILGIALKDLTVVGSFRKGTLDDKIGFIGDEAEGGYKKKRSIGPVNGPLPLQEFVTASYYLFGLAIAQMALEQQASRRASGGKKELPTVGEKIRAQSKRLDVSVTESLLPPDAIINRSLHKSLPLNMRLFKLMFTPEFKLKAPFRVFGGLGFMLVKAVGVIYLEMGTRKKIEIKENDPAFLWRKRQLVSHDALTAYKFDSDQVGICPLSRRGTLGRRFRKNAAFGDYAAENGQLRTIYISDRLLAARPSNRIRQSLDQFLFDITVWSQAERCHAEINWDSDELAGSQAANLTRLRFHLTNIIMRSLLGLSAFLPAILASAWHRFWISQKPFVYLSAILSRPEMDPKPDRQLIRLDKDWRPAYISFAHNPDPDHAATFLKTLLSILETQHQEIKALENRGLRAGHERHELKRSVSMFNKLIQLVPLFQGEEKRTGKSKIWTPAIDPRSLGVYQDILRYLGDFRGLELKRWQRNSRRLDQAA